MPEEHGDWSNYIAYRSAVNYILALIGGFTFTSMTVLVTSLGDTRTHALSQIVLLFATVILDLLVFLILLNTTTIFRYVQKIPPRAAVNLFTVLMVCAIGLWGYLMPLILLLFKVTPAGYIATAVWTMVVLIGIVMIYGPFEKRRRAV